MIVHSREGAHWAKVSAGATAEWIKDVAWGAGRFVTVGRNGTIVVSP